MRLAKSALFLTGGAVLIRLARLFAREFATGEDSATGVGDPGEPERGVYSFWTAFESMADKGHGCAEFRFITPARGLRASLTSLTVNKSSSPASGLLVEEKLSVLNG